MAESKIEWTYKTWNPVTGCTKYSLGCQNCYAERMAKRLQAMGQEKYKNGFKITLHPKELIKPKQWKQSSMIFVNSMSDLFHEEVLFEFIKKIFDVMNEEKRHIFQILTKRAQRLVKLSDKLDWGENIWMGVTVEHINYKFRIDLLKQTNAKVKFLSLEPLLSDLGKLDLSGIDWVIVGGESGPGARPIKEEWVINIMKQCKEQGVSFYFKQWGGVNKKKNGRLLNNRLYIDYPEKAFEWQKRYGLKGLEIVVS